MNDELAQYKKLLISTRWSAVPPPGKLHAINFLRALKLPPTDFQKLLDFSAANLALEPATLRTLLSRPDSEVLEFFSQRPRLEGDWIEAYLDFTANHEAPEVFHFWTALSILSAATARNVRFPQNYYDIWPNLYVVLVAPAGRCRRSVATHIGIRILREADVTNIISEKVTPEALAEALHTVAGIGHRGQVRSSLIIHAPELSVFLGKQTYNEGMVALLTTLYDSPDHWEYRTRTRDLINLEGVFLNLFGATAPDWLADCIPAVAFGGGFLSRTFLIAEPDTPRVFPFPEPEDLSLRGKLVAQLQEISKRYGDFKFSPEAREWYVKWYEEARNLNLGASSFISGYFERKQDHIIRVAMLLALASGNEELILTPSHLERALAAMNRFEPNLSIAFRYMGANPEGQLSDLVLWKLRQAGGSSSRQKVMHSFLGKLTSQQVDNILRTLIAAGAITYDRKSNTLNLTPTGWNFEASEQS